MVGVVLYLWSWRVKLFLDAIDACPRPLQLRWISSEECVVNCLFCFSSWISVAICCIVALISWLVLCVCGVIIFVVAVTHPTIGPWRWRWRGSLKINTSNLVKFNSHRIWFNNNNWFFDTILLCKAKYWQYVGTTSNLISTFIFHWFHIILLSYVQYFNSTNWWPFYSCLRRRPIFF